MTPSERINGMRRLCEMRQRLAQRDLQSASQVEQRRAEIAAEGRERHHEAEREAQDYVSTRFATADLGSGAAVFFASLAIGHRQAEREAVSLATRAERLAERHRDASEARASAARHMLRAEQRLSQHSKLADDLLHALRFDEDEAEEEESQEIRAGRGHDGVS
ncbi:MAG: hypothetical protein HC844_03785 [Tabrizicola sp.]|nr:hypothetical protein [Tabrizicola sp.]